MVAEEGLEPPTSRVWTVRSSQLSYSAIYCYLLIFNWWRLGGSNPWPPACKAGALPAELSPHGYLLNGREDRIRTCDPLVPNQVLYQAEPLPEFYGAPKRSRTPNLLIRSQTLYPIELWALFSWCLGPESNRHGCHHPQDFKSCASTSSATQAFHLFQGTRLFLKNGVLQRTRTSDPLIKSQMLYQLS